MTDTIRCGNCGRFADVRYEWSGPHYGETIHCENCGGRAYRYDPWAEAIAKMSEDEIQKMLGEA